MPTRVAALALNTFRESVRDKVLLTLLVFGGLVMAVATVVPFVALGEGEKIVKDVGLSAIAIFSVLIAILVGGRIVYLEAEKRTIYLVLARPVRRMEFVLGKYIGLLLVLLVSVLAMTAIFYVVLANVVMPPRTAADVLIRVFTGLLFATALVTAFVAMARPRSTSGGHRARTSLILVVCAAVVAATLAVLLANSRMVPTLYLLWAVLMTCFELALVTAIAVMFSTFVTPIAGAVFTFALYFIGHSTPLLKQLAGMSQMAGVKFLGLFLYYLLPNLTNFNVRGEVVHNAVLNPQALVLAGGYALIYSATLLLISMATFSRKDF
jgi:ABC-type transport system involved in multi-copper enzyme maturation permease subunit